MWNGDLWPFSRKCKVFPVVITARTFYMSLFEETVSVSSVLVCFHLCLNRLWLGHWDAHVLECAFVCVCVGVCERQRVLNMCWRSQRNSRALIRTSPGWQLVNSVLRIGVFYSYTKECKLVPVPSGLWKPIHMARSLTLLHSESCATMQLFSINRKKKNKQRWWQGPPAQLFCLCRSAWVTGFLRV